MKNPTNIDNLADAFSNGMGELSKSISEDNAKKAFDLGFLYGITVNDRADTVRPILKWLEQNNLEVLVDYVDYWHVLDDTRTFWFREKGAAVLCKMTCI